MYELKSIEETLTKIAALAAKVAEIRSDEHANKLHARYDTANYRDIYPAMFGELSALADQAAREARYALERVRRAAKQIEPLERLQAVMEDFEVMANETDTRELRLLETLVNEEGWKYENRQLHKAINKTLTEIEEGEWEQERERAEVSIEHAGFLKVERDDFEGYERGTERITIEMEYDRRIASKSRWIGYTMTYQLNPNTPLGSWEAHSGQFAERLATISGVEVKQ